MIVLLIAYSCSKQICAPRVESWMWSQDQNLKEVKEHLFCNLIGKTFFVKNIYYKHTGHESSPLAWRNTSLR